MSEQEYKYYLVESYMVTRVGRGTTERLLRDGTWEDYDDRWRVLTEGRLLDSEDKALDMAQRLWAQEDSWK